MNGGKWGLGDGWAAARQQISQWTIPACVAPTGSMGNNGAITLGTALPFTYDTGIFLYLPASAISAGSAAGWYWTVMSSTTLGVVYNNTFSGTPSRPASNTAFATTGPGAYTGVTAEVTVASVTLPAGVVPDNARIDVVAHQQANNSGGNKTLRFKFDTTAGHSNVLTTNLSAFLMYGYIRNGAALYRPPGLVPTGGNAAAGGRVDVDLSAASTFNFTLQMAAATDYSMLQSGMVTITG